MRLNGHCHCGNLSFQVDTQIHSKHILARACDCLFCRIHAAKNWSDPDASAVIQVAQPDLLQRYRFALKTADFYICRQCGVYLGAVLEADGLAWSTLNLRLTRLHDVRHEAASYQGEDLVQRIARRKRVWTPTITQ